MIVVFRQIVHVYISISYNESPSLSWRTVGVPAHCIVAPIPSSSISGKKRPLEEPATAFLESKLSKKRNYIQHRPTNPLYIYVMSTVTKTISYCRFLFEHLSIR